MGRVYDVAVLGAGVARLTAAYRLKGRDVVVLEAEDHIGGRTLSKRFDDGSWANYAAQYVSTDKVKVVELADELGVDLVPSGFHSDELRGNRGSVEERAEIDRWVARLEAEMANPRPATAPELDGISVGAWLGDAPEHVHAFFERWCGQLIFASTIETSLYGLMLLWGDQRTSAFTVDAVPRSNRGDTVFDGGTNSFTHALAQASGAELRSGHHVTAVARGAAGWVVTASSEEGEHTVHARQVICALPAPVALSVIAGLPAAKADALGAIRYGRNIATPIAVLPDGARGSIEPTAPSRAGAIYNTTGFVLKTPGDIARDGGCFHAYVHDGHARVIWDDPPESIRSGALRAFAAHHPELAGRVHWIGFRRWEHALPQYRPGRQALQGDLETSLDGLHFCGDYVTTANMDGAARSGEAAAAKALAAL
jgi:protoporphyrinogen/coproporphyrinogen III oxidase